MKKYIKNCTIVTNGKEIIGSGIITENGKILELTDKPSAESETVDLGGKYIAPGFVDIHCHGGGGYEFYDSTYDSMKAACDFHRSHGTAIIYPTLSAVDNATMVRMLECMKENINKLGIKIPGVHLEGPYLAPEMCGAQDTSVIRAPEKAEYESIVSRFGNIISRWSYAPERDADCEFVRFLSEHGIVPATAHSSAELYHIEDAKKFGNRLVTHLYSCTSTVTRHGGFRHLGVIESAYLMDDIFVEAIGDGCHIPPELMRMIIKIKGAERVCLITDAIRFAGIGIGSYGGNVPYLIEDGVAKLTDRSAFAGSIASTDIILRRTVEAGIPMPDVVRMLTETPAAVMGLTNNGKIDAGYDALFTVFDKNFNASVLLA